MSAGPTTLTSVGRSREQTRAVTRAALLESAESHFLAKGYRGASLEEIAESAGYSKGAIYSNFASKDGLFLAVSSARGDRTSQPLLDALHSPGDAEAKLAAFSDWLRSLSTADNEWILVETEFTLVERRSPEVAAVLRERYRLMKSNIAAVLVEQLEALGITPTVDVAVVAETMLALESGLALSHAVDDVVGSDHFLEVLRALIGYPRTPGS